MALRFFLSLVLAAGFTVTAFGQKSQLTKARELVAAEQFADARLLLDQLVIEGNLDAALLRNWIGERENQAQPKPLALSEWVNDKDERVLAIVRDKGAGGLVEVAHDGRLFRAGGLSSLFERSRNAIALADRLAVSQSIVDFLHDRPWVWFTERGILLGHHHDLLVESGRLDDAIEFLTDYALPRRARLCLRDDDDAADQPQTWPFMGEARMSPIDMLLITLVESDRCAAYAKRLEACREPEAQYLRQLSLLGAGNTSEIDEYLNLLVQNKAVLFKEAGGKALQDQYLSLLGDYATKNGKHAAAAICYERAFVESDPLRTDRGQALLAAIVRAHGQTDTPEAAGNALIERALNTEGIPPETQRYALRIGRTTLGQDVFDAQIAAAIPDHPLVRVPEIAARLEAGETNEALVVFEELWRNHPVELLAESPVIADLFPTPRAFADRLMADGRFVETLRTASPGEAKAISERLADWMRPPTRAERDAGAVDDVVPYLELCQAALNAYDERRRLRHPAFQTRTLDVARSLLPRLDNPADRKAWYPLFLLPADALAAMKLRSLPGVEARPDQLLKIGNIAQENAVERYLDTLDKTELIQLESALPEGSGLRHLVAVTRGGPVPEGDPGMTYSWLSAKALLKADRYHDLMGYLRDRPERREIPGLLFIADSLIATNQTTAARFVLSLGADDSGQPLDRLDRIRKTSRKLADIGNFPDAIDQVKGLLDSPLPRLRREGQTMLLGYEREWFEQVGPAELKRIIDEKVVRLQQNPNNVELLEQIIRMYAQQHQFGAVVKFLEQRAALERDNASTRVRIAVTNARHLEQPEEAWIDFLKAHEIDARSWIDSRQIALIHEVALSKRTFLSKLGGIKLLPLDENPDVAGQYYNVVHRCMRARKVAHAEEVLVLVDKLLAFPKPMVQSVVPRLNEFRVKLLLQLGRKAEARAELGTLFVGNDGPTWDMRLGPTGPEGLAATYRDLIGKNPSVASPIWGPLLAGWDAELNGEPAVAAAAYKRALANWPNAIADQTPHLLARLAVVQPGPERHEYLLNTIQVAAVGRPDVLAEVVQELVRAGHGQATLARVRLVRNAKGLTEAGRQRLRVMESAAEFAIGQSPPK